MLLIPCAADRSELSVHHHHDQATQFTQPEVTHNHVFCGVKDGLVHGAFVTEREKYSPLCDCCEVHYGRNVMTGSKRGDGQRVVQWAVADTIV